MQRLSTASRQIIDSTTRRPVQLPGCPEEKALHVRAAPCALVLCAEREQSRTASSRPELDGGQWIIHSGKAKSTRPIENFRYGGTRPSKGKLRLIHPDHHFYYVQASPIRQLPSSLSAPALLSFFQHSSFFFTPPRIKDASPPTTTTATGRTNYDVLMKKLHS